MSKLPLIYLVFAIWRFVDGLSSRNVPSTNIFNRNSRTIRTSMESRWKESLLHKQNWSKKARRNRRPPEYPSPKRSTPRAPPFPNSLAPNSLSRQSLTIVAMPITAFALGTWQVYRLKWKKGLIERYSENLGKDAIILPKDVGYVCAEEVI